ncbi:MAG: type II toxin-antitoxin system RelE/ParE family toxin [Saprospiraceae bacterium]|nr:type II toxin-antitoxin system RelE/ParE family toxin [Saprospiraceae bacterium]
MALQIIWTVDAKKHLNDILDYWCKRNGSKTYSQKLYLIVKNALITLSKYPESGKLTENPLIKAKIIKDYYLFYTFDNTHLIVVGFCDMRRDPEYIETLLT